MFHATYVRLAPAELERLSSDREALGRFPIAEALADGRAVDLGGGWEELGCLLEGGYSTPESGPTVGDRVLADADDARWGAVEPHRVVAIAAELEALCREAFFALYNGDADDGETADRLPGERTGEADNAEYLYAKFVRLQTHYARAAAEGAAMLVRIAERR